MKTVTGWLVAGGLTWLCLWPLHDRLLVGIDEGSFLHVSDRILGGEVPYRDFNLWEPPGHYYLFVALQLLFGRGLYPSRIAALVVAALTAVAVGETLRHRVGGVRAGLAGAFGVVAGYHAQVWLVYYWTSALFAYFALVMALRAADGAPRTRMAMAGFLATLSFMMKQNAGAYASLGVFFATLVVSSADGADIVRRILRLMLGVIAALLVSYVAFRRARMPWNSFWESMFAPFFSGAAPSEFRTSFPRLVECIPGHLTPLAVYNAAVKCTFFLPFLVIGIVLVREALARRRGGRTDRRLIATTAFSLLFMLVLWPFYYHDYLNFCLPLPMALLLALLLEGCMRAGVKKKVLAATGVCLMVTFFAFEVQYRCRRNTCPATGRLAGIRLTPKEAESFTRLEEAVAARLRPGDDLLAFPFGDMVHAIVGRPSRSVYVSVARGRTAELVLAQEIRRIRPHVVVVLPESLQEMAEHRQRSAELATVLRRDYTRDAELDGTEIWVRLAK